MTDDLDPRVRNAAEAAWLGEHTSLRDSMFAAVQAALACDRRLRDGNVLTLEERAIAFRMLRERAEKAEITLAAARATIAGQGEQLAMVKETAKQRGESVEFNNRRAEAAIAQARIEIDRCDGEAGWKPPVPVRYIATPSVSCGKAMVTFSADDSGQWVRYADLTTWERGERPTATAGSAGETVRCYDDISAKAFTTAYDVMSQDYCGDINDSQRVGIAKAIAAAIVASKS